MRHHIEAARRGALEHRRGSVESQKKAAIGFVLTALSCVAWLHWGGWALFGLTFFCFVGTAVWAHRTVLFREWEDTLSRIYYHVKYIHNRPAPHYVVQGIPSRFYLK